MSFSQSCLGIDLREDRVVLAHLKKSFGKVWLTASKVSPITPEKGKEEREAEIINSIQGFISSHNFSKENVILALSREKALVKLIEIPSAARENLRKVLEYELGKHIPFPPEESVFDFQILDEKEGMLRVLLVVMKKEEVNGYLDLFKRMGIRPAAIEIPSTAVANLFYYDQHPLDQTPFALLDIEKHFFEFHFFEKGSLREGLHHPFFKEEEKAKELKEAFQLALLKGLGAKDGKQNLFAFGGEASETLIEKLKLEMTPEITLTQSFKKIHLGNGLQKISECYPSVGLALRGLSKTRWTINLLPLDLRKKISRIGIYLAVFLSCIALVLAAAWVINPWVQEREELKRILGEVKAKKPKVAEIEAIQKKKDLVDQEIRDFDVLRHDEISKVEVLRELSEILPATTWIWNLKLKSKDVEINGFANSASDLIALLDKSPLFEKVEFSSPVTKERRLFGDQVEKERFRISAKLEKVR